MQSARRILTAIIVGGALCFSTAAANASVRPGVAIPSAGSAAAVCATAPILAGVAAVGQASPQGGCVLPVVDAPVAQLQPAPAIIPAAEPEGLGIGLPVILGLLALAAGAVLLLSGGDDEGEGSLSNG